MPPRFRLSGPSADWVKLETRRETGERQLFSFAKREGFWESLEEIPEPHGFDVVVTIEYDGHARKTDERSSWLKSIETFGLSVKPRMPLSGPFAAFFTASLISSLVVARLATNLRSMTETFGVGTRIAEPSSLPLSSGRTRPTALAAPVVVGILDKPPGRRQAELALIVGEEPGSTALWRNPVGWRRPREEPLDPGTFVADSQVQARRG